MVFMHRARSSISGWLLMGHDESSLRTAEVAAGRGLLADSEQAARTQSCIKSTAPTNYETTCSSYFDAVSPNREGER
jgi:hypothetical protein